MKPVLVLRHAAHEVIGSLEDTLDNAGVVFTTVDQFIEPIQNFDPSRWGGLIGMGGPMNVDETERFPFLADELGYLRQAIAAELPVLGVCLGSQLLAKSLGSKVYPNRVKEIGWYDIDFTPAAAEDPLFAECRSVENVFQWHGDTFDMPPGAVQLASGAMQEPNFSLRPPGLWSAVPPGNDRVAHRLVADRRPRVRRIGKARLYRPGGNS